MIELSGEKETRKVTLEKEIWNLIEYWSEFCDMSDDRTITSAMGAYDHVMELGINEDRATRDLMADVVSHLRESM